MELDAIGGKAPGVFGSPPWPAGAKTKTYYQVSCHMGDYWSDFSGPNQDQGDWAPRDVDVIAPPLNDPKRKGRQWWNADGKIGHRPALEWLNSQLAGLVDTKCCTPQTIGIVIGPENP